MARGAYWVFLKSGEIEVTAAGPDAIPPDQLALQTEVARTDRILRAVARADSAAYRDYQQKLLALAQAGLVGDAAQPQAAGANLEVLRDTAIEEFGPVVKNRYMAKLLKAAVAFALSLLVVALALFLGASRLGTLEPGFYALVLAAASLGVYVSFSVRKLALRFSELQNPEGDFMQPGHRLASTVILTFVLTLAFSTKGVVVTLGALSTEHVLQRWPVALLVGFLCGFSEKALPSAVRVIAGRLMSFKAPMTSPSATGAPGE